MGTGLVHAKSKLGNQVSGVGVDRLHKVSVGVPETSLWLETLKVGSRRVETGDVAKLALEKLAGISGNVRAQRVTENVERIGSDTIVLAEIFDQNGDHRAHHSGVGGSLAVGEKVPLAPIDQNHVELILLQELVSHLTHPGTELSIIDKPVHYDLGAVFGIEAGFFQLRGIVEGQLLSMVIFASVQYKSRIDVLRTLRQEHKGSMDRVVEVIAGEGSDAGIGHRFCIAIYTGKQRRQNGSDCSD